MISKGEASLGFDKTNKNVEDLLHSRPRGQHVIMRAKHESFCVARALSRRAAFSFHVDTSIFSRDKTVLTMGEPEVNPIFINKTLSFFVSLLSVIILIYFFLCAFFFLFRAWRL